MDFCLGQVFVLVPFDSRMAQFAQYTNAVGDSVAGGVNEKSSFHWTRGDPLGIRRWRSEGHGAASHRSGRRP
jgi:hypothetical protein